MASRLAINRLCQPLWLGHHPGGVRSAVPSAMSRWCVAVGVWEVGGVLLGFVLGWVWVVRCVEGLWLGGRWVAPSASVWCGGGIRVVCVLT